MLKKYAILLSPDANTGGDSSTPLDDKGADSSQQQDDQTIQQDDSSPDDKSAVDDSAVPSDDTTGDDKTGDQQDDQSQQQQQQDDAANVVVDKEEDKALPFHKHARFQELIAEKTAAKQEYEKAKPLVEQASALNGFMQENNISAQEFQSALQYLKALRTDPMAAFKMLEPTYKQLAMYAGEVLPDDLQAKVATGTLELNDARQLAQARAQQTYQSTRQQWRQNGQQQQVGDVVGSSITMWEGMKKSADPDFKQGTPLYELVDKNIRSMPQFRTAQDAIQGCEKAYADAKVFLGKFQPKTVVKQKPGLQSRQQGNGNQFVIKDSKDAITAIQRGLKPHQIRYA